MKTMKHTIACTTILLILVTGAAASELTMAFLDGIKYYKAEEYAKAASAFSGVADAGIKNGKLFYNLGNAYLKNGRLGHAVLWYERALRLIPDDPDLKFNHEYALSLIKDEADDGNLPIFRVLFFWKHLMSSTTIQWTGIMLNLLAVLMLTVQVVRKKKKVKTTAYLLLILAGIFILTAFYNFYETAYIKKAVILPEQVSVRSGLTENSTELFVLHTGTKVKIEKENKAFFRIFFSDGKIGWIKKSDAGVI
ncbi:tetratricopeptide repeat protein [Thermodesulfobacteriota bacterium]